MENTINIQEIENKLQSLATFLKLSERIDCKFKKKFNKENLDHQFKIFDIEHYEPAMIVDVYEASQYIYIIANEHSFKVNFEQHPEILDYRPSLTTPDRGRDFYDKYDKRFADPGQRQLTKGFDNYEEFMIFLDKLFPILA